MKSLQQLLLLVLLCLAGCQKQDDLGGFAQDNSRNATERSSGSGGGGNGGGGGNNPTGFLQNVFPFEARLVGGTASQILVSFTQPAPAGGWTLIITSNDPALQVPATYFVPEGSYAVYPAITTSAVTNARTVTFTVKLGTQTKSNSIKLFPATATFPAPILSKPGNGAKFNFGLNILFDWNDNNNAWYHDFQVSTTPTFNPLWFEIGFPDSYYTTNYFNTGTSYWRVRFVDASGNPGPWSEVRNFFVKPQ